MADARRIAAMGGGGFSMEPENPDATAYRVERTADGVTRTRVAARFLGGA